MAKRKRNATSKRTITRKKVKRKHTTLSSKVLKIISKNAEHKSMYGDTSASPYVNTTSVVFPIHPTEGVGSNQRNGLTIQRTSWQYRAFMDWGVGNATTVRVVVLRSKSAAEADDAPSASDFLPAIAYTNAARLHLEPHTLSNVKENRYVRVVDKIFKKPSTNKPQHSMFYFKDTKKQNINFIDSTNSGNVGRGHYYVSMFSDATGAGTAGPLITGKYILKYVDF